MVSEERELPSLEEIAAMDRQRQEAFEALEIYDHSIKCQRCGIAVPIVEGTKSRANAKRITTLEIKIRYFEDHNNKNEEIKARQELESLQTPDTKYDKIRNSALYYTRGKFRCGSCFDKCEIAYQRSLSRKNKKKLIERHVNV
jgi:peptide subunit release factor RF-3